ncbi:MAG TPA: HAMP domain-containing histidine kinase [Candidatus Aquabacterium excrementipullorum]|nr:HAMP domain-containing histidine kinase [Candidatus Aquabacterium excrementipullorum]
MTGDNPTPLRPHRPATDRAVPSPAALAPPDLYRFMKAIGTVLDDLGAATARLQRAPTLADCDAQVRRLHDTVELLSALRAEFLSLLALSSPQMPTRPGLVDAAQVCQQAVALLHPEACRNGVRLGLRAPPSLMTWADPSLLARTVRALVSNAIRYNQPGGHALVCARATALGGLQLRVWDSGLGLSRAQQGRLFLPFERLGKELCLSDGTGMGLAMARSMATLMGATLSVRSRPGRGSLFRLDLPPRLPPRPALA